MGEPFGKWRSVPQPEGISLLERLKAMHAAGLLTGNKVQAGTPQATTSISP